VVERSALCEAGGKQADIRTDFQEISRHSAVPTQKTYIVLLRAFARRQWNRDHVLGLTAVKSIELTLSIVGAAKQSAAFRALEIREENPRLRIAGEECAVTIGAQRLRWRRRGNASFGICRRRAAARTRLDLQIIVDVGRMPGAVRFQLLNVIHGLGTIPIPEIGTMERHTAVVKLACNNQLRPGLFFKFATGLVENGIGSRVASASVAMVPNLIQVWSIILKQLFNWESWNRGIFA
jgi:hypothetical protein